MVESLIDMRNVSPQFDEQLLKNIPPRGKYYAVRAGTFHSVEWRHGEGRKTLIQFLGPNAARQIASDMNFSHQDAETGETIRSWEILKIAWWNGQPEPSRLILPFAR